MERYYTIAEHLDARQRAGPLVTRLQAPIAAIAATARNLSPRPTVACIEWIDPLMTAGNWVPELVEIAGGRNSFGTAGLHSARLRWKDLCTVNPEVIIVMPCGFDMIQARQDITVLRRKSGWRRLRAVVNGRVYLTDGNQYFNRPGPRLVESLEILADILNPDTFRFGHAGTGWEKL